MRVCWRVIKEMRRPKAKSSLQNYKQINYDIYLLIKKDRNAKAALGIMSILLAAN